MTTNDLSPEKRIAQEHCHDAYLVGIDLEGGLHYWSSYHWTIVLVEDGEHELIELDPSPLSDLRDWREYVEDERGWDDCRIGGTVVDDLAEGMA